MLAALALFGSAATEPEALDYSSEFIHRSKLVLRPVREWLFTTEFSARVFAGEAPRYGGAETVRPSGPRAGLPLERAETGRQGPYWRARSGRRRRRAAGAASGIRDPGPRSAKHTLDSGAVRHLYRRTHQFADSCDNWEPAKLDARATELGQWAVNRWAK